jgi:hypothetical protein
MWLLVSFLFIFSYVDGLFGCRLFGGLLWLQEWLLLAADCVLFQKIDFNFLENKTQMFFMKDLFHMLKLYCGAWLLAVEFL